MTSPGLGDVYRLWSENLPNNGVPAKPVMDPLAMPSEVWPRVVLIDVTRDPLRFQYRLTGTWIDYIQNRNLTGTFVDENRPAALRDTLLEDLTKLTQDLAPQYVELRFTNQTGNHRSLHVLRLPLASAGGPAERVDHVFLAFDGLGYSR